MSTPSPISQNTPNQRIRGPPELDPDFAMKLIEKEVELEKSWQAETVHDLVLLYTQIIEYYEYYKDPKYYDFQDRMHKMLVKPKVIEAIQEEKKEKMQVRDRAMSSSPKLMPVQSNEEIILERKKEAEKQKNHLNAELNKNIVNNSHKQVRNVNRIIKIHETNTKEIANKAMGDFKSQDEDLERRLASRKKVMTDRSMDSINGDYQRSYSPQAAKVYDIDEEEEFKNEENELCKSMDIENDVEVVVEGAAEETGADESGGLGVSFSLMGGLEDQLEDLMERSFSEKAAKIAEVKVKYETQIRELEGQGGLMNMVIDQMKENMRQEIENLTIELDNKRRQEIRNLKESFQLK